MKIEKHLPTLVGKGYRDFWNTRKRYRVCKGSRGSKKSKTTALNMIYRIFRYPECNILCVRRYGNTLRDSVFSDLKWAINRFGLEHCFSCTLSPMQITRVDTGQKILFRGFDDGLKITSISVDRGVLNFVWIEEAYEVCEDDFNKLDMSIRGEVPENYFKQITLTFNPWSAASWLKARFFDVPDDDIFTKTTTWQCNEWLDEADRNIFLKMKENNPRRYKIEGEGDWGIAEGLVYDNVVFEGFEPDEVRKADGIISAFGLDFGFTDPNALLQAAFEEILWFINAHLTNAGLGSFDNEEVEIIFNRDILINETEAVTNCQASVGILSDETIVSQHPWVDDPEKELERIEKQRSKDMYDPFEVNSDEKQ